jgi:hypothetical protein
MKKNFLDKLPDTWKIITTLIAVAIAAITFNATYATNSKVDMVAMKSDLRWARQQVRDVTGDIAELEYQYDCRWKPTICVNRMEGDTLKMYERLLEERREALEEICDLKGKDCKKEKEVE